MGSQHETTLRCVLGTLSVHYIKDYDVAWCATEWCVHARDVRVWKRAALSGGEEAKVYNSPLRRPFRGEGREETRSGVEG